MLSLSTTLITTPKLRVTKSMNVIVQSLVYRQYSKETWIKELTTCERAETLDKNLRELASIQTLLQRKEAQLKESELDGVTGGLINQDHVGRLRVRHLHL